MPWSRTGLSGVILRFASGLRFPWLFALTLAVLLVDVAVPDFIPFADEVLLGLVTLLLAAWRKSRPEAEDSGQEEPGGPTITVG